MSNEPLAPLTFTSFSKDGRTLQLDKPITFNPYWDGQSDCFVIDDESQLGLKVFATGETVKELIDDLVTGIFLNWDTYVLVDVRALKNGQRIFRSELMYRIKEEDNILWAQAAQQEFTLEEGNYATESINKHEALRKTAEGLIELYGSRAEADAFEDVDFE